MPRAKNEKVYQDIISAAHELFLEKGYDNTSYQDIAESCGQKRNLVQYYFPYKTMLAVSFFEKLIGGVVDFVEDEQLACDNPYATMLRIGYLHFAFLLKDEKTRSFTEDVLRSRELTDSMLLFDFDWGMEFLAIDLTDAKDHMQQEIIYAMGGFYELLYASLKNGNEMNVESYLRRVVIAIAEGVGISREEATKLTENSSLSKDLISKSNVRLRNIFAK